MFDPYHKIPMTQNVLKMTLSYIFNIQMEILRT